ncbi:helix-turn-helix domain-containing protein [Sulfurospirillum sp. 1612]|uniref:helix-turn-helix domain-containing protein n=1 Tax=Sulfurospirillum sp. 1612 TaxID=3094835 RepID=UPI002F938647
MIDSIKTASFELNILDRVSTNYKLHTHENICMCAISQGEMLFFHDGENILLKPAEIIVFNTNQPHCLKDYHDITRYYILHLYKEAQLLPKIIKEPSCYEQFLTFCTHALNGTSDGFIDTFLKEYQAPLPHANFDDDFEKIKNYIDANLEQSLSLEALAQKTKRNRSYLSRGFKKKYGLSPSRYIFNKRVHRSKTMLDEGKDITHIALELGFCDQSHFYKAFKSIFSITPNEYKQMKRRQEIAPLLNDHDDV